MITFREKIYSIEEGHYTGPKDVESIPSAVGVIGKSTLVGAGIGAGVNYGLDKIVGVGSESPVLDGVKSGGKWGLISGIFLKLLLNHIHKPMTSVKYNEVDKLIRKQFGIYRVSGITFNDSLENRKTLNESFSFNDREVLKYKINISICDNSVTLYTFNLSDLELTKTSDHLDYYCKKYFGMEYTSKLINKNINSYSVNIVFTNYNIISLFIIELSKILSTKINILNNKAVIDVKSNSLQEENTETKDFSLKLLDKYDLAKIFISSAGGILSLSRRKSIPVNQKITSSVIELVINSLDRLSRTERANILGNFSKRSDFNNKYLESSLNRLRYIEGVHYTIGEKNSECSVYLSEGMLIICISNKSKKLDKISKILESYGSFINNLGDVTMMTHNINSRKELDSILVNLMNTLGELNIHTK